MNSKKLESKRITRWLLSAEISAEMIDNRLVATAHEDNTEDGHFITNFKWCVREVARIKQHGVSAYLKKVGDWCAVYSGLTTAETKELRELEITVDEVKAMIDADARRAA